jgi:hypothetical protein
MPYLYNDECESKILRVVSLLLAVMGIKEKLYNSCKTFVSDRIESIQLAINDAQSAANNETKSTAGDKHDTSRAMMQLEVEQKSKQLGEAKKLQEVLSKFGPESGTGIAGLGSLVKTTAANYYISISAGKLEIDGEMLFAISAASPIGQQLINKTKGDSFQFNGKNIDILEVL